MVSANNTFCEDHSIRTCPVSGLAILQKPEWRDVNLANGYKVTISLVGDNILLSQPHGYATLEVVKQIGMLTSSVLANSNDRERPYVQLEDYSLLTGASLEARKYYIDYLKNQERLLGLVFIHVSPMIKLSIKLARRIKRVHFNVEIADNYDTAVRIAQTLLTDRRIKTGDGHEWVDSKPYNLSSKKGSRHRVIHHPDWHLQFANFSLRFEVINDKVLHGITSGRLEKSHIEPSIQLQDEVTRSAGLSAGTYYYVLGLKDSAGTSQKARKQYVTAILRLYKKNPFRMFVFYGANRLIKAGINLARPFIPFKVGIVDDLDLALSLIAEDETKNLSTGNFSDANDSIPKPYTQDTIQQHVKELLQFLEEINWESGSLNNEKKRDPAHPFSSVFDAIELMKWEFDDLIQEKKQSEEEIRRAKTLAEKANNAKSEFLANMSHELRTPLNHIIGFTELVVDKNFGELNEVQEEYLGDVLQSSNHLLALINDILDLSKVEAGKQELERSTFNPVHLLESSLVMVKEKALKHSIQLSLDTNGIPESIQADERMFKQVMYNLLSNAAKFTPDGGQVSVTAQTCDLNAKDYRAIDHSQAWGLKISVSDTGIGIHPADLKRIFSPFEQVENSNSRKYQGTGLGLSLCRNFVNLHGGKIWAESKGHGHGSSFHFVIPVK